MNFADPERVRQDYCAILRGLSFIFLLHMLGADPLPRLNSALYSEPFDLLHIQILNSADNLILTVPIIQNIGGMDS